MKLAVSYIMELFPCYGRERGQMIVSEQGTVNYLAVEVKKKLSLAGTFLDQKLCFDCRKNSHIFPLLSCGSELLHRFAFSFCCKI